MPRSILSLAALALATALALPLAAAERLYTLGPDDYLVVRALDVEEFDGKPIRIDGSGAINLPMIGRINAAGLTIAKLEGEITLRLKKFLLDPQVTVSISEFRPRPVSVFGAVARPGQIQLRGPKTLWELISDVGGFKNDVGNKIRITRRREDGEIPLSGARVDETGKYYTVEIDTKDVMEMSNPDTNIDLAAHDVISVSTADVVYVVGHVNRAGGFVTNGSISLLEAISLSGGFKPDAKQKKCAILRVQPGTDVRRIIPINLKRVLSGKSEDIVLKPQDIVYVPHDAVKDFGRGLAKSAIAAATYAVIYAGLIY